MCDHNPAAPSLAQASTDRAHREHLHQHNLFHNNKRQTATDISVQSVITEVVQTVSVVAQIDVNPNGSTFSIQTVLADSTGGESLSSTTTDTSAATTTNSAIPATTNAASSPSSTLVDLSSTTSQSLLSNQSITSTSSSISSIPTSSFASLTVSYNSTKLISSSSSLTPNFSNSSITSSSTSSASSFTYLLSSSSSSYDYPSSTSSIYSAIYSSSDSSATSTGGGGIIAGGGSTAATGSTSTSTAAAGNGSDSTDLATSKSAVVGGVVGGVAGLAIFIALLMLFVRWKKQHSNMLSLGSGDPGRSGGVSRAIEPGPGPAPTQPSVGMTEGRSSFFAVPGALASLSGMKRGSRQTDKTTSTDAGGERGFYRVSGRKLPSVLQTGGSGYGDDVPDNTLSGASFYRDSQGFYGGQGSPVLAAPIRTDRPESGIPVMRPSPARTPVTEHGPFLFSNAPPPLTPPLRPDLVGRSHPSQDGSLASRFTEEV